MTSRIERITAAGREWRAVLGRNRPVWVIAVIAVASLVVGLAVGRLALAASSAEKAPEPGLVTVPVALGTLTNDVTFRGEIAFADAVEVKPDTADVEGPAVVTGQVPQVGTELAPLSIALEVAGRPLIVLPGELPAYRTLRAGVSGPDVVQFKQALRAVGIDAGDPGNPVFDAQAATAVTALYAQAGYAPPSSAEGAGEAVRTAQDEVAAAQQAVTTSQLELTKARSGPSAVEIREADNAVASARRELLAAQNASPPDADAVADLADALALAELQRSQLSVPRDTSAEKAAVHAASTQSARAATALAEAQQKALPSLPVGEVLYLTALPRRVDSVEAARGKVLDGSAMTVSGATLGLSGSIAEADAALLTSGDEAVFDLPGGEEHRAVIGEVLPGEDAAARWTVTLVPDPLTPDQVAQAAGANVRVSIPVEATAGEVLSVPVAALTAGPGGESRVEVVDGDPRDGERAETHLVEVETGLATDGAVEVRPSGGDPDGGSLDEGDLVVVGR